MYSPFARNIVCCLFAAGSALFRVPAVRACAACGCGDPTLTVAGTEQPFANRLRASAEARYRSDSVGEPGVDAIDVREFRTDLSFAWAPGARLFLLATLPFVYREVTSASLAKDRAWGIGDVELRAKLFAFRDREFAPRHLLSVVLGLKAPTAPFRDDENGEPLPLEAQSGTGSWDLLVGPAYALFAGKVSLYASAQLQAPVATRAELEPGPSLRGTLAAQYQALESLAVRPALDARWDAVSREQGELNPNSGGFVLFAGADVLVSPIEDFTVLAGVRVPVVQELTGYHDEGLTAALGVSVDF